MKTKTKKGLEVELMPVLRHGKEPNVHASFDHPKAGHIESDLGWGDGHALGNYSKGRFVLNICKADYDKVLGAAEQIIETAKQKICNGETKVELYYRDGEHLDGYAVRTDFADDMLIELGLAKYVRGWGVLVDRETVMALGESFTWQQAVEYIRPQKEAAEKAIAEKEKAAAEHKTAKIQEAREKGTSVVLKSWSEPCDDPDEECNLDMVRQMIDGSGNITLNRSHTW